MMIALVYGHCNFFKNNAWFSKTNRKKIDEVANHSTHIRKHIEKQGYDTVERWLDICLSVEDLIDPHSTFLNRKPMSRSMSSRGVATNRAENSNPKTISTDGLYLAHKHNGLDIEFRS